ncbi:MAG: ArsR/SmtB family transcription factor [Candidatus Nanohaloarchaea archaeon]
MAKEILKSELATYVLVKLAEEESYSTELSKKLNKKQSSISRTLSDLKDHNLVKESKRGKAQYYKVDYEGLGEFLFDILEESHSRWNKQKQLIEKLGVTKAEEEQFPEIHEKIKEKEDELPEEFSGIDILDETLSGLKFDELSELEASEFPYDKKKVAGFGEKYYRELLPNLGINLIYSTNPLLENILLNSLFYDITVYLSSEEEVAREEKDFLLSIVNNIGKHTGVPRSEIDIGELLDT